MPPDVMTAWPTLRVNIHSFDFESFISEYEVHCRKISNKSNKKKKVLELLRTDPP